MHLSKLQNASQDITMCLKCQFLPCIVSHVVFEAAEDDDDGDEDDEGGDDAPGGRGPPHEEMLGILYERRTKFVPKI